MTDGTLQIQRDTKLASVLTRSFYLFEEDLFIDAFPVMFVLARHSF